MKSLFGSDDKETTCNVGDLGSIPGSGRSPGKGMAIHSSVLAWKIPGTEKPRGLQSMGSQRVRHDLETKPPTTIRLNAIKTVYANGREMVEGKKR